MRCALACTVWIATACGAQSIEVARSEPEESPSYECQAPEMEWFVDPAECPEPAREVVRFLDRAAQLSVEGNDEALLALYADDATIVYGRRARAEPYDVRFDRARFAAQLEADTEPSSGQIGIWSIEVWFEDGAALASALTLYVEGSGEDQSTTGEIYRLVRVGGEWRIAEARSWPVDWGIVDEREVYDDAYWARADERVDAARRALDAARAEAQPDAQRALMRALRSARRPTEALPLAVALTESPERTPDDWYARSSIEESLGDLERARVSAERAETIGWPSAERVLFDALRCVAEGATSPAPAPEEQDDEEESEEDGEEVDEEEERCSFEIVARASAGSGVSVAIAKLTQGAEHGESHVLLVANETGWRLGTRIADGPFLGNQTSGVDRFDLGELELRDLVPGGSLELHARYTERRYPSEDDDGDATWVDESGHLVCELAERPRCGRIADRVSTTIELAPGERTIEATATVALLPDGRVRVTARRGRHPRLSTGERAIGEVLADR